MYVWVILCRFLSDQKKSWSFAMINSSIFLEFTLGYSTSVTKAWSITFETKTLKGIHRFSVCLGKVLL